MKSGWTRFRTAVIALGLLAWSAPHAVADDILTYSTSGAVGTTGITGSGNVISFVPVQKASVDTASNISLGYFQVAGLSTGQSTTYDNTPITLTFVPTAMASMPTSAPGTATPTSGTTTTLNDTPITVTGYLNGSVSGPYQSSVQLSFNPISGPTFAVPNGTGTFSLLPNDQELLVPSSVNNGQTTLQAKVDTTGTGVGPENGVPEPSTIALFLSMVGGVGLRRYLQGRRQRSAA